MHKIKSVLNVLIVEMHKRQCYNNNIFSLYEKLNEY